MRDTTKVAPSPSAMMRSRRPHLFSDSYEQNGFKLSEDLLEHALSQISEQRKTEEFEDFVRRVLEVSVCPNLNPQTGPVGGGDSKADTETHPVAEAISDRWYSGLAKEAANERWAFAFSSKKRFKSKIEEDVKKIVGTERGYTVIYCISSQLRG